ncbi:hypothetical protein [Candidatus Uabimicrobium amorphum]|uniref:Uncharacterized protein n=1 Tax=Uabimicrobium amorphum TaxID=2596890 RepID=A0A5S9ING3_UABAM|nr:hypothetical protein [Candidatus Uabimicrobium amorphum]BBM84656.1 hypothetical protein UABAM_03017 [Candidatus Uabimicrobium amorphum]
MLSKSIKQIIIVSLLAFVSLIAEQNHQYLFQGGASYSSDGTTVWANVAYDGHEVEDALITVGGIKLKYHDKQKMYTAKLDHLQEGSSLEVVAQNAQGEVFFSRTSQIPALVALNQLAMRSDGNFLVSWAPATDATLLQVNYKNLDKHTAEGCGDFDVLLPSRHTQVLIPAHKIINGKSSFSVCALGGDVHLAYSEKKQSYFVTKTIDSRIHHIFEAQQIENAQDAPGTPLEEVSEWHDTKKGVKIHFRAYNPLQILEDGKLHLHIKLKNNRVAIALIVINGEMVWFEKRIHKSKNKTYTITRDVPMGAQVILGTEACKIYAFNYYTAK